MEGQQLIKTLTAKEMKNLAKPEFAKNPEEFYPTQVFQDFGFSRAQCTSCGANFWRHTEDRQTCGDSNCVGTYSFIGKGSGKGAKGTKITYAEAWEGFRRSLTSARIPCTAIDRYPVVARWRNDVEYVAAGIYCFQPYCVTGEMEAPANPLICPQFCVRFNDLDNIGLTGRHYSGFIMLGIQVFNLPGRYKFFKEECVEFNLRWLIDELEIPPDEITLIEDVWAGGGNLGPSVEYFVNGLEVGNMVFMQYKTFPDGSREELAVKVIDVGIGLERIPWLINGTPTSYMDVFAHAFEWLRARLGLQVNEEVWSKFGPLSCLLNIDEVDNIDATWERIAELISMPVADVKAAISPIKDMYIILDHTRTVLMVIEDGSLPSNVGGGANVRNVLRRVFAILSKNQWWDALGMDGLLELFQLHKRDLTPIYGEFKEYKSFDNIIRVEYDRWMRTDQEQRVKLEKLLKKNKGTMSIDDWIVAITSWGLPADRVAEIAKQEIPGNLYYEIDYRASTLVAPPEAVLYNTEHLQETENLYYQDHRLTEFEATVVEVLPNVSQQSMLNIVILDRSAFYPTSGGQAHDTGSMVLGGEEYQVVDVIKAGHCVLHILDRPLESIDENTRGASVTGRIDMRRRTQLRNHHTGTHIVFASCRQVLGPHVWQNGAKKTEDGAHLDITHYKGLTHEEEIAIENAANRIISSCVNINKSFMDKTEAEIQHGFSLYQGGIVPGNNLRVVNIEGIDTEACCGTHCDNTAEVGWVRITKTNRISDGIVRLYYVAGEKAIQRLNEEDGILNKLNNLWGISLNDIVPTAERFFSEYKKLTNKTKKQEEKLLELTVRSVIVDTELQNAIVLSDQPNPTIYFSFLSAYASELRQNNKGIVFLGDNFIFGLLGNPENLNLPALQQFLKDGVVKQGKFVVQNKITAGKGKTKTTVDGVAQINYIGELPSSTKDYFLQQGFKLF